MNKRKPYLKLHKNLERIYLHQLHPSPATRILSIVKIETECNQRKGLVLLIHVNFIDNSLTLCLVGEIAKTIQTSNGSKVTYVALAPGYVIFSQNYYEKISLICLLERKYFYKIQATND